MYMNKKKYISIFCMFCIFLSSLNFATVQAQGNENNIFSFVHESPHNYLNNTNDGIIIQINDSNVTKIRVHFSKIDTERWNDRVVTSAGDTWSGEVYDVWSEWQYGNQIQVNLKTSSSVTDWGYKIDKVEVSYQPESEWKYFAVPPNGSLYGVVNYENNADVNFSLSADGAKAMRVHFRDINIEKNYDFLEVSSNSSVWPDKIHGDRTNSWSSWFPGDTLNFNFTSDGSTTGVGFLIDKVEYMEDTKSDFPWTDIQFNIVGPTEKNPDYGDAQRRLADRKNCMPDEGEIHFFDNVDLVASGSTPIDTRSIHMTFKYSPEHLQNLVIDGNETLEVQTEFYNLSAKPTNDPYNRPQSAFNPWLKTFEEDNLVAYIGDEYDDEWDFPLFPDAQGDRGTYFYVTNLPSSAYPDTLYPSVAEGNNLSFSIGVSDAQQLDSDEWYMYKIIGAKNNETDKGIFGISAQRGYNFNHYIMPNTTEFYAFNEEYDEVNEQGTHSVVLSDSPYTIDTNDVARTSWKLHDIINMADSRYANIFAKDGWSYKWDSNGRIYVDTGSGYTSTVIDRQWDLWNTNWFKNYSYDSEYTNN